MKRLIGILCLFLMSEAHAQHAFQAFVQDKQSGEPLPGATARIQGSSLGASAGPDGLLRITNIPDGQQRILISFVGYEAFQASYHFPLQETMPLIIRLEASEEALEEVVVTATRSSRTIADAPTRMEVITAEELGEKAVMNSTNIAMLLRESTGIQMQQTSASSANQSIRIQGLDGRYTQLLKDGFPLFGGFAGGLSIMQIPPLDLQQVEVIKGSSSTLYGGGAIAGLINLVTKKPQAEAPELSLMLNQTSAGGTTANAFYAEHYGKTGLSLYSSANRQQAYDPNDDGFSDIPRVRSLSVNPRFFWYPSDDAQLWVGINTALEDRTGGDLQVIDEQADAEHQFSEQNLSKRISSQLSYTKRWNNARQLQLRNSLSYFDREIKLPDYRFQGRQYASFSEATYRLEQEQQELLFGANLTTEDFQEKDPTQTPARDYQQTTVGAFAQHNWSILPALSLESGLRSDYAKEYGWFVLPRLSLLYKAGPKLSMRLGGGLGYKLPGLFTEDAERLAFRNVQSIYTRPLEAERSQGGNFDLNYKTLLGDELTLSINQLFFYTRLQHALLLEQDGSNWVYRNADGRVDSKGFETNLKLGYHDFKLFLQYALTDVHLQHEQATRQKPLTPKHTAGAVFMFEQHGKWRIGLEAYYTGRQFRSDYSRTRDYWITGLMALREIGAWSLFLNFENFLDTRQSRYQEMVQPPYTSPSFAEIWAPTDGFVMNGGFIWKMRGGKSHH